ncbi:MAG: NYN domain-containing protein [Blastocatellia bacterium]|nr:NYN domain-containing protein [Blastocatellia bacterium]
MRATSGITAQTGMTGMRGRVAIFIDGNNLFHAARSAGVEIDYAKLLNFLRGESPLLRAFFYTGVDERAERQQGFLLWMRRNGYRVVQKELKTFPDGTKKANLDVEIAVDMLSLVGNYDTAILVSGDEDFAYAINVIAYKGVRVEIGGFRSNTSPRLIDVADRFIDFDGVISEICKAESRYAPYPNVRPSHTNRYAPASPAGQVGSVVPPAAQPAVQPDPVPAATAETMPVVNTPQPPQPEPPVADPYAAPPSPGTGASARLRRPDAGARRRGDH